MKKIIIFALILLIFSGCVSTTQENKTSSNAATLNNTVKNALQDEKNEEKKENVIDMSNIIEKGDTIKVDYKGTLNDGTEFDSSLKEGRTPLEFTAGAGQMIKGFDKAVIGMKLNDEKTVILKADEAYGETRADLIIDFPLKDFEAQGIKPEKDMQLFVSGKPGKVVSVDENTVHIDFNHDLAGKELTFWIKIVEIQKGK